MRVRVPMVFVVMSVVMMPHALPSLVETALGHARVSQPRPRATLSVPAG